MTEPTTPHTESLRLITRLMLTGLGIVGLLLLATAHRLEPDPRGYGTHEQLGLTPCHFKDWTGHQCPACGSTTAWAHALRGDLLKACSANLGGALLCGATLVAVPWLFAVAIFGRWLIIRPTLTILLSAGTILLAVVLLDWYRRWLID